jgi:hypothetical protein
MGGYGRSMLRTSVSTLFAIIVVISVASVGAAAAEADPLGLTVDGGVGEGLGLGVDTIAVWVCEIPDATDPVGFTAVDVAAWANDEIAPFFTLISGGRYRAVFEAAREFTGGSKDDEFQESDCLNKGKDLTTDPRFSSVFVMDNISHGGGLGTPGGSYVRAGRVIAPTLDDTPDESRRGAFAGGRGYVYDLPSSPTHEIGHTIGWPHSGSGTAGLDPYDNPADIMSGKGVNNRCTSSDATNVAPCWITHTIAFNRYASGWIAPEDIELVTKAAEFDLVGPESSGPQMALLPSGDPLIFSTIEARPAVGYDENAGTEGVILHTVDQTAQCSVSICWGPYRRQKPAVGAAGSSDHILGVGESAALHGMTISVLAATASGYTVSVSGLPEGCAMGPNPFTDVRTDSFAFNDIGCIRLLGITTGTSAATYSPGDTVTRAQMAAFLGRLFRSLGNPCSSDPTPFDDIAGSFAAADIACIYALGVTTGTSPSTYAPDGLVTREQMAAFLGRLWRDALGNPCSRDPTPFDDIAGSFAAADIACIYALGITTGTSPTSYDPGASVTREQMAAFLARFWKAA